MVKILFNREDIQKGIEKIADQIMDTPNRYDINHAPIFICVLNGAFVFFSDLIREMPLDINVDFIRVKAYDGKMFKELKIIKDLELDIKDREIFLVDDIYDTGQTINKLIEHLEEFNPKQITPVTLFKRQGSIAPKNLIYGIDVEDDSFLVGYGMNDENDFGRNLSEVLGK